MQVEASKVLTGKNKYVRKHPRICKYVCVIKHIYIHLPLSKVQGVQHNTIYLPGVDVEGLIWIILFIVHFCSSERQAWLWLLSIHGAFRLSFGSKRGSASSDSVPVLSPISLDRLLAIFFCVLFFFLLVSLSSRHLSLLSCPLQLDFISQHFILATKSCNTISFHLFEKMWLKKTASE